MIVYYIENRIKELNQLIKLMEYNLEHTFSKKDYRILEAKIEMYRYALNEVIAIYDKIKECY